MNDFLLAVFSEYGFPTAMVLVLIAFILLTQKNHREERNEWREDARGQADRSHQTQKETNEVLRSLTGVIQEINRK